MLTYIENNSPVIQFYECFLRENPILRRWPSYFMQYRVMRSFHRRRHPFMWLREGDRAVQVGSTEWMLDFGVSQALTMAAIVGPRGHILAIEPDQRNIDSLNTYMSKHGVTNISIVKKAAWKEKAIGKFTFYLDRTSSNAITTVHDETGWDSDPSYAGRPQEVREIEMDTIDNITSEMDFQPTFVNMTINNAELDAIYGMPHLLEKGMIVAWLLGNERYWWRESLDHFENLNYDVVVGNAPYSHRAPSVNGKPTLFRCSEVPQLFYGVAVRAEGRVRDPREFPADFEKKPGTNDFVVNPLQEGNLD